MDLGDRRPLELLISISTIKVHRLAAAWLHDHGCMALCGRLSHGHPVMLSCYASRSRRPLCTTDVLSLFAALGQLLLLQSHPSFCCRCRHERASARAKADPQPSGSGSSIPSPVSFGRFVLHRTSGPRSGLLCVPPGPSCRNSYIECELRVCPRRHPARHTRVWNKTFSLTQEAHISAISEPARPRGPRRPPRVVRR